MACPTTPLLSSSRAKRVVKDREIFIFFRDMGSIILVVISGLLKKALRNLHINQKLRHTLYLAYYQANTPRAEVLQSFYCPKTGF